MKHSRREFVRAGAASLVCGSALAESAMAFAKGLDLPLGLQLYSVRDQLPQDYSGTLKELGSLGFREVESAGYYGHTAAEVKRAMDAAGLRQVSSHYAHDALAKGLDEILAFEKELGVEYIICSYPGKDPAGGKTGGNGFSLADWRWNAKQFNAFGEKVKAAGMKFGYHNHYIEFQKADGVLPFDEIVRLTDPAKVTIEMDCGWVVVGGGDPVALLRKYPERISMLHVKDFKMGTPSGSDPNTIEELGKGTIDYAPVFAEAARTGHIRHCFVEQEGFTVPWKQSLKIDADYMRRMGAAG